MTGYLPTGLAAYFVLFGRQVLCTRQRLLTLQLKELDHTPGTFFLNNSDFYKKNSLDDICEILDFFIDNIFVMWQSFVSRDYRHSNEYELRSSCSLFISIFIWSWLYAKPSSEKRKKYQLLVSHSIYVFFFFFLKKALHKVSFHYIHMYVLSLNDFELGDCVITSFPSNLQQGLLHTNNSI